MPKPTLCLMTTIAAMLLAASAGIAPQTLEQTATNPGFPVSVKTIPCLEGCHALWQRSNVEAKIVWTLTNDVNADVRTCTWEGPGQPVCVGPFMPCSNLTSRLEAIEAPQATTLTWDLEGDC